MPTRREQAVKDLQNNGFQVIVNEPDRTCLLNDLLLAVEVRNDGTLHFPPPHLTTVEKVMAHFGFTPYHTGGGCMAYYKEYPAKGFYRLITDHEDPILPTSFGQMVMIGEYDLETGNLLDEDHPGDVFILANLLKENI